MGRASWLGLCPNSLHRVEVWACTWGLRSGLVNILFSIPSEFEPDNTIVLYDRVLPLA